jgi:nitric oxide reductase NorQ protein
VAEAREDVIVVLHPLADHRRELHVDRLDQTLPPGRGSCCVASYNPGYRRGLKELKPSTRQRFIAIALHLPGARARDRDRRHRGGDRAGRGAQAGGAGRQDPQARRAGPGRDGVDPAPGQRRQADRGRGAAAAACAVAVVTPLSDDAETLRALQDLVDLTL